MKPLEMSVERQLVKGARYWFLFQLINIWHAHNKRFISVICLMRVITTNQQNQFHSICVFPHEPCNLLWTKLVINILSILNTWEKKGTKDLFSPHGQYCKLINMSIILGLQKTVNTRLQLNHIMKTIKKQPNRYHLFPYLGRDNSTQFLNTFWE